MEPHFLNQKKGQPSALILQLQACLAICQQLETIVGDFHAYNNKRKRTFPPV